MLSSNEALKELKGEIYFIKWTEMNILLKTGVLSESMHSSLPI